MNVIMKALISSVIPCLNPGTALTAEISLPVTKTSKKLLPGISQGILTAIREDLTGILADTLVGHYEGFLGIDQMICRTDSPIFIPVSEINLRMTMGLIARNQYDQSHNLARQLLV